MKRSMILTATLVLTIGLTGCRGWNCCLFNRGDCCDPCNTCNTCAPAAGCGSCGAAPACDSCGNGAVYDPSGAQMVAPSLPATIAPGPR